MRPAHARELITSGGALCHAVAVAVILATPALLKVVAGAGVLSAIAVGLRLTR
jgi:hypothetical protein